MESMDLVGLGVKKVTHFITHHFPSSLSLRISGSKHSSSHTAPPALKICHWKITIFNGKIHYKWQFSIAMLVSNMVIPNFSFDPAASALGRAST